MKESTKKKPMRLRNFYAVQAWAKKSGPHKDRRRKRERKYPKQAMEEER